MKIEEIIDYADSSLREIKHLVSNISDLLDSKPTNNNIESSFKLYNSRIIELDRLNRNETTSVKQLTDKIKELVGYASGIGLHIKVSNNFDNNLKELAQDLEKKSNSLQKWLNERVELSPSHKKREIELAPLGHYITKRTDEEIEQIEKENLSELEKKINSLDKEFEKSFKEKEEQLNALVEKSVKVEESAKNAKNAFSEEHKLHAAREYWANKKSGHFNLAIGLFIAFLLLIIVTVLFSLNEAKEKKSSLVLSAPTKVIIDKNDSTVLNKAIDKINTKIEIIDYLKYLFLITLVIWVSRILLKLTFSNLHLKEEAHEKETMILTYLALINDGGGLENEDRKLILEAIFRPSTNGLIKDESNVTLVDLINSIKK